jgi:antitoxin (DNA-binding transcriptional repressor) of toxin-antitoxin stability system
MYMWYSSGMEVPITKFRREIFTLVNQALDGEEIWVRHKGRRVRIVAEQAPSKLSRITPMDIIAPGVDLKDKSWKEEMMREWEQKWSRRLAPLSRRGVKTPAPARGSARKIARKA